jgi:hypothetical protein
MGGAAKLGIFNRILPNMTKHFLLSLILAGASFLTRHAAAQKPTSPAKPASTQSAPPQKPNYPITPADTAIQFLDSVFHRTNFLYQQVEPDIPKDIQPILLRFNNALVANRQWFEDYRKAYAGKPLPYNERFGISAGEYQRLQNLEKTPLQLSPVDTQKITVLRDAGSIHFKTDGDVHLFEFLQIDLQHNLVFFGGDTIKLIGRTLTTPTSPYGEWEGYTWRYEQTDAASTIASSLVTAHVAEINIGITPKGRLFLRLKYQNMREGVTISNLELAGYVL